MDQNGVSQHTDELVLVQMMNYSRCRRKCPDSDTVCIYSWKREEKQSIKLLLIYQKLPRATFWQELTAMPLW